MTETYNMLFIYSYWTALLVLLSWLRLVPSVLGSAIIGMFVSGYLLTVGNMKSVHISKKIGIMVWKIYMVYISYTISPRVNVRFELICFILYLLYLDCNGKTIFKVYCTDIPRLHADSSETITEFIRNKMLKSFHV